MKRERKKSSSQENILDATRNPMTESNVADPIGTGVEEVVRSIGGLPGKAVAEKMDPAVEDAYWKTNFSRQGYVKLHSHYANYQAAYRAGYEGRERYPGKSYEEMEAELQRGYENSKANALLGWDKARHAIRAAWHRLDNALPSRVDRDELPVRTRRGRLESILD